MAAVMTALEVVATGALAVSLLLPAEALPTVTTLDKVDVVEAGGVEV